jgi:lipid A 3-O-deacylase
MSAMIRGMLFLLLTAASYYVSAQSPNGNLLFRISHDNDLLNYPGKVTDDAYSAGLSLDVFFTKNHISRFFLDKNFLARAGQSSTNVYQWGIAQQIYTPQNLKLYDYIPDDYPYSAALYAVHALYSYNNRKQYSLQTEIHLGVMGPPALGGETQTLIHEMIDNALPHGWSNQLKTDILLNYNFTAEKQIFSAGHFLEFIGGGQASVGTETNSLSFYPLIRIGKMNPYFDGYIKQYSAISGTTGASRKQVQLYLIIKPEIQWVLTNALLQGGVFSGGSKDEDGKQIVFTSYHDLNHLVYAFSCGVVATSGRLSMSFTQHANSMLLKNTYAHEYGNISVYYSL